MLEIFVIRYTSILPNFVLIVLTIQKKFKHKRNFHHVAMPMMTSQILKSADFTKTQESKYLKNGKLLFLQIKKNH